MLQSGERGVRRVRGVTVRVRRVRVRDRVTFKVSKEPREAPPSFWLK
jgi:hypothetical protein